MVQPVIRSFFISLAAGIMLAACSVPSMPVTENNLKMPGVFNDSAGTAEITPVTWKRFFTDTNLTSLIDVALHNNLDLNVAWQRVVTARAVLNAKQASLLPSVNATLSAGLDKYGDYTMNGVGNYDTNLSPNIDKDQHIPTPTTDLFLGLRTTWEADVWGKLKAAKKAAFAHYLATQKGRQWLTTQLVAAVAGLYYDLLAYDNNMRIIQRNIQLQENALNVVKIQKEGGRATELA
ncbi:MAG TPA: TolC family protein, partial [Chitinophagaceae bacterium]|nr:TolC family protein [Chitinophagaceae bacterium]